MSPFYLDDFYTVKLMRGTPYTARLIFMLPIIPPVPSFAQLTKTSQLLPFFLRTGISFINHEQNYTQIPGIAARMIELDATHALDTFLAST
jgi:hypothetical protein